MPDQRLLLASASPRRSQLLRQIGIEHDIQPADIDESPHPSEPPDAYTQRLAREKATVIWRDLSEPRAVLGADTSVVVDGTILGKPDNPAVAKQMLMTLSGRVHEVFSAVALLTASGQCLERINRSEVTFKALTDAEIDSYLATGESPDKAGAYGIQGQAAVFISHLSGSYTGVMGLPLYETARLLMDAGLKAND